MMKSEMLSWPVTLAILVLAFGALVAAGLPLLLTLAGLVASAGSLVLINHVVPVSVWAMNFAMMFALALGIDYALFIVVRFRAARMGHHENARQAVAETMDTAGKAVLLSGATVLISLSAVMLVPSPSFRSMAGGIMLSVVFVLAATLTLLPLVLFKLDYKINKLSLALGPHRRAPLAEVRGLGGAPLEAAPGLGSGLPRRPARPGRTGHRAEDRDALDQGPPPERQRPDRLRPGPAGLRRRRARHPDHRGRQEPGRRPPLPSSRTTPGSAAPCRRPRPPTAATLP